MYDPAPPEKIDQSVIVDDVYFYCVDERMPAVVLNPACDFEQDKAELVQFCGLTDAWEFISELLHSDWDGLKLVESGGLISREALSIGKAKSFANRVRQLARQQYPRFHWFTPLPGSDRPLVADFQVLAALPFKEVADLPKLASLRSPFREQVPARYSTYMNRVGTPDFSEALLKDWVSSVTDLLFPDPAA